MRRTSHSGLLRITLLFLLTVLAPSVARAALDNKGTDFITSFLPNTANPPVSIEVHLTADAPTMVTVDYPVNAPTFTTTVPVNPGTITIVSLPDTAANGWPTDVVSNNAVRLSAPVEFVAYLINRAQFTSDAALGLPIDTMNTEYIVSTYNEAFIAAQFVVTAAFDNTTVTITPSNDAQGGHLAGTPFNVVLDRGEGIMVRGAVNGVNGGLAGSIVTSDKPVGITNGNDCTQVPVGVSACDTVFEVAQPTQTWGLEALVVNLPDRPQGTIYRVVASQDATTITQDGAPLGAINRGQFIEVGPITGSHVFAADKPIFVTQYMTGNSSPGATTGDPAMGNMIPTEQFLTDYTFSTVGGGQFALHFLTVIANNADLATITLDGVPIGVLAFTPIAGTSFSSAVVPLTDGTHSTSSINPHGITVEGYNGFDSYLYPGGALFQFINPVGDANPPICANLCMGSPLPHCDGSGTDNRPSEDVNNNSQLDPGEDLNGNNQIDTDTGIFFVELAPGATNLTLIVPPFVPGAGVVPFTVDATSLPASGTVVVTDGAGNTCQVPLSFAGALCGNGAVEPPEQCDDGNLMSGDGCSSTCQLEGGCVPADCNDENECTDDACVLQGAVFACENLPNTEPCDDDSPCTLEDVCSGGQCVAGMALDCDDDNPCTDDSCDPLGGAEPCLNTRNTLCAPNCGNLTADPGETCDPPDLTLDPVTQQTQCRLDCTSCGDGVTQTSQAETCDDGNTISGCDPIHPQKPLDPCQNNCTQLICKDPARIILHPGLDSLRFHGRLNIAEGLDLSNQPLTLRLNNATAGIFEISLPAGALTPTSVGGFRYRNGAARKNGGISRVRITRGVGSYKVSIDAYGDLDSAVSDMTTHVILGTKEWTVRGLWDATGRHGWRLNGNSTYLQP